MTASAARPSGRLLQVLGLWFGIAAIIGNTIGAGIMRTPTEVARQLPTPTGYLLAWLLGGLYAALGAASLAELGVLMPRSGGQYVFAKEVFGPYAGFVFGFTDWVSTCASAAAVSMVLGEYASGFGGSERAATPIMIMITALGAVLLFSALQWRGVKSGDRTQQITTLFKALALLGVPLAAFFLADRAPEPVLPATGALTMAGVILAMQSVIYSYDGWNGVLYFSEEVGDPVRDIPRSMFGGVFSVIVIYMLLAGSFLYVLGIGGVAASAFPAAEIARQLFGTYGDTVIRAIMIVSLMSAVNAIIMMASRVPYAMSRDGLFPKAAAAVNTGGTPSTTLAISSALATVFIVTGTFNQAIAIAAFFFVLQYVMSFTAVFVLRRREPERPRPYRAIGYPLTTAISWLGGVAFLIGAVVQDRANSLVSIGILLASYPVFRILRLPRSS